MSNIDDQTASLTDLSNREHQAANLTDLDDKHHQPACLTALDNLLTNLANTQRKMRQRIVRIMNYYIIKISSFLLSIQILSRWIKNNEAFNCNILHDAFTCQIFISSTVVGVYLSSHKYGTKINKLNY